MFGSKILEEVSAKIGETIANSPAKDMEKNVKAMLGSAFNKMAQRPSEKTHPANGRQNACRHYKNIQNPL